MLAMPCSLGCNTAVRCIADRSNWTSTDKACAFSASINSTFPGGKATLLQWEDVATHGRRVPGGDGGHAPRAEDIFRSVISRGERGGGPPGPQHQAPRCAGGALETGGFRPRTVFCAAQVDPRAVDRHDGSAFLPRSPPRHADRLRLTWTRGAWQHAPKI